MDWVKSPGPGALIFGLRMLFCLPFYFLLLIRIVTFPVY